MEVLKLKNSYKLIKSDKTDMIAVTMIFPISVEYENSVYISILKNILLTTNYKYKDRKKFNEEKLRAGVTSLSLDYEKMVNTAAIEYNFLIPRENLIKDYDINCSFSFAIDCLVNPNMSNGLFDEKVIEQEKSFLTKKFENSFSNINSANKNKLFDIIDVDEKINASSEHYKKILEGISNKKVVDFYNKNIKNNKPIVYVFGNIEKKKLDSLFSKYYPLTLKDISITCDYYDCLKKLEYKCVEIPTKFSQTEVDVVYQTEADESGRYKLALLGDFLTARENNLVFKKLREENNLVYQSNVLVNSRRGFFIIKLLIRDENIEKALVLIDEIFESLKNYSFVENCLNRTLKYIEYDRLRKQDSIYAEFGDKIDTDLKFGTLDDTIREYKSITIQDEIDFIKKVEKTQLIIFRGAVNDKN